MSIAMERFGSSEQPFDSRALSRLQSQVFPYRLQCRECGFEPVGAIVPPPRCTKCFGHSFERFVFPRSLLMCADRRANYSPAHGEDCSDAPRKRNRKAAFSQFMLGIIDWDTPSE